MRRGKTRTLDDLMQCLRCDRTLTQRQTSEGEIWPCFGCGAVWFPGDTVAGRLLCHGASATDLLSRISAEKLKASQANCLTCVTPMRIVTYQITDLDYCPQCHGIFFDKGEFSWIARGERKMDKRDIADVTEVLFYALGGTIEW